MNIMLNRVSSVGISLLVDVVIVTCGMDCNTEKSFSKGFTFGRKKDAKRPKKMLHLTMKPRSP